MVFTCCLRSPQKRTFLDEFAGLPSSLRPLSWENINFLRRTRSCSSPGSLRTRTCGNLRDGRQDSTEERFVVNSTIVRCFRHGSSRRFPPRTRRISATHRHGRGPGNHRRPSPRLPSIFSVRLRKCGGLPGGGLPGALSRMIRSSCGAGEEVKATLDGRVRFVENLSVPAGPGDS